VDDMDIISFIICLVAFVIIIFLVFIVVGLFGHIGSALPLNTIILLNARRMEKKISKQAQEGNKNKHEENNWKS